MFGPPGIAYVYFTYGMHHCLNAVAHDGAGAGAVLLRAIEPEWGIELMRGAGAPPSLPDHKLASGPGRICRALGIGKSLNGSDLTTGPLRILPGEDPNEVLQGPRIGLGRNDDGRAWRLWTPSRSVSR
jgi:DNA-3-methyladenine glycosylase